MTLPTWEQLIVPVLKLLADGRVWRLRDVFAPLAETEALSKEQLAETLRSGQFTFQNRVGWTMSYLYRVDALDRPAHGAYAITDIGRKLLADHPEGITERQLRTLINETNASKAWFAFGDGPADPRLPVITETALGPTEQIEQGIAQIDAEVSSDLLDRLRSTDPAFFEAAVVKLLVAMGYGGADGRATVTGQSHDGGIDGIIDLDALGLDQVYVQAKRYADGNNIGRETIQAFAGALNGVGAQRGVFITSSAFTPHARDYARSLQQLRIVLIDGARLAQLMIKYRVGVQVKQTYDVVQVDEDFFE